MSITTTLAPWLFVIVVMHRIGAVVSAYAWILFAAILIMAIARALVVHARLLRRLRRFEIVIDRDALVLSTVSAHVTVPRSAVTRAVEIPGALGGLRLELTAPPAGVSRDAWPNRIDIPRGGERFGEVRAFVESWCRLDPPARRSRAVRIAMGLAVIAAIFFVPFLLDDLATRSRWVVAILVLATWLAVRTIAR